MHSAKCATQINPGHQFTGLSSSGYQLLTILIISQSAIISQLHLENCSDPRSASRWLLKVRLFLLLYEAMPVPWETVCSYVVKQLCPTANRYNTEGWKLACNEYLSLLADKDMKEEWPSSTQGRVGVMTPAGGDRFLGRGTFSTLAGTHEEADSSSRPGQ